MQDRENNIPEYKIRRDRDIKAANAILQYIQENSSDQKMQEGAEQIRKLIDTFGIRFDMYDKLIEQLEDERQECEEIIAECDEIIAEYKELIAECKNHFLMIAPPNSAMLS